jgi:hypothetical protein
VDANHGWLGRRSVAFWTVVSGMAAVVTLVVAIGSSGAHGSSDNVRSTDLPQPDIATGQSIVSGSSGRESRYLADLDVIGLDEVGSPTAGPVEIAGVSYARSILLMCVDSGLNDREYNLGGKSSILSGVLGFDDDEDASGLTADITIYGDGNMLIEKSLTVGNAVQVSVPVRGFLRLRIACQLRWHDDFRMPSIAFGNALLEA